MINLEDPISYVPLFFLSPETHCTSMHIQDKKNDNPKNHN